MSDSGYYIKVNGEVVALWPITPDQMDDELAYLTEHCDQDTWLWGELCYLND